MKQTKIIIDKDFQISRVPRKPSAMEVAPANAASIELINANDEPRNTGLLNLVKS